MLWTLNVQHLESLSGTVFGITGVRETIFGHVMRQANEVIPIDITPRTPAKAILH